MIYRSFTLSVACLMAVAVCGSQSSQVNTAAEGVLALKRGNGNSVLPGNVQDIVQPVDRKALAGGQAPFAAILTCADSRVPPEIIFDQGPGRLFVVRVAGNVADPATLGSIEYSVEHLHSKVVLVLGHANCGAVSAAMMPGDQIANFSSNIQHLLHHIEIGNPTGATPAAKLKSAAIANVRHQMKMVSADPAVQREVAAGKVQVVGGYYDILTGKVEFLAAR